MTRALALLCVFVLLILQTGLSTPAPISITGPFFVSFNQKPAPKWLVRVEPSPENRRLYFLLMDEGAAPIAKDALRRSQEDLDGAEAAKFRYVSWASLPDGEMRLWVLLHTTTGEVARASVPVTVLAKF